MLRFVVSIAAALAPCVGACDGPATATPVSARVEALLAQHLASNEAGSGSALQVGLRSMHTVPGAPGDLALQGEAVVAGAALAVPVRFEVVLDRASGQLLWVDLRWSESGKPVPSVAGPLPVDPAQPGATALAPRVSAAIAARLAQEFDAQPSAFELGAIELRHPEEGAGHLLAVGRGTTVFVGEASVPTRFSAVFDRASGELLALRYALHGADGDAAQPLEIAAAPTH